MSDSIEESNNKSAAVALHEILANNFMLAWTSGGLLFTEMKNAQTLRDAFQAARKLCKSDMFLVQEALNANEMLLERVIERNNSNYKGNKELASIGNDICELIRITNK